MSFREVVRCTFGAWTQAAALLAAVLASGCENGPTAPVTARVASVSVSAEPDTVSAGDSLRLTATVRDERGNPITGRRVVWSSEDTTVVSVDSTGLAHVRLDPPSARAVRIEAVVDSVAGHTSLWVTSSAVASVTLLPASDTIYTGDTLRLVVTVRGDRGQLLPERKVEWVSNVPDLVAVDTLGRAVAIGRPNPLFPGWPAAFVIATSGGRADTARVTVVAQPSNVITRPQAKILLGRSYSLAARMGFGAPSPRTDAPVSWSSSDTTVLSVTRRGGLATAHRLGRAVLTAQAGQASDTMTVEVVASGYTVAFASMSGVMSSTGLDVNDAGQVLGIASTVSGDASVYLWDAGIVRMRAPVEQLWPDATLRRRIVELGSSLLSNSGQVVGQAGLPVPPDATATAFNDHGGLAGVWGDPARPDSAFIYSGGRARKLAMSSTEHPRCSLTGILLVSGLNNNGSAAGAALGRGDFDFFQECAFLGAVWHEGELVRYGAGRMTAINNAGAALRYRSNASSRSGFAITAHLTTASGDVTPLGRGLGCVVPHDLNEKQQVVGTAQFADCLDRNPWTWSAFLWEDGRTGDLSALVTDSDWVITAARGINEQGDIVGSGRNTRTGQSGAVLLRPAP